MTATYSVSGDKVTVKFSYTASASKMIETVKSAVKQLYMTGQVNNIPDTPFEALTNQQFLDILDAWILEQTIDKAKQQLRMDMLNQAMADAVQNVDDEIKAKFL